MVEKTISFSMMVKVQWQAESLEEDRPSSEEPQQRSSREAEVVPSEPCQGSLELGKVSTELGVIEFQRKKLHNRCTESLKMQQFKSRNNGDGGRTREEEPVSTENPEEDRQSSEEPEPGRVSTELDLIGFRRRQLHNRRMELLKMQQTGNGVKKDGGRTKGEVKSELEAVQEEMEELVTKEEELLRLAKNTGSENLEEDRQSSEEPEPRRVPTELDLIQFRRRQLHNRRMELLKMQQTGNRVKKDGGRTKREVKSELEAVQKEMEELVSKEEELLRLAKNTGSELTHTPPAENPVVDRTSSTRPEQQNSRKAEVVPSEPSQGSLDQGRACRELGLIQFRRQRLHSRRSLLLKMQQFKQRGKDGGMTKGEDNDDQTCELEAIQKELEVLLVREEELLPLAGGADLSPHPGNKVGFVHHLGGYALPYSMPEDFSPKIDLPVPPTTPPPSVSEDTHFPSYKVNHMARYGGIYVLPLAEPPRASAEEVTSPRLKTEPEPEVEIEIILEPEAEKPPENLGDIVEVEHLDRDPAVVECPSCGQVVTTETCRKVGTAMWMVCAMSAMLGCVAGCCLIPFCMERLSDVSHQCPLCHSHIQTSERL